MSGATRSMFSGPHGRDHVAFGNPYPQFTGADWDANIHVDVIPTCCTIEVDGRVIMRDGEFTI